MAVISPPLAVKIVGAIPPVPSAVICDCKFVIVYAIDGFIKDPGDVLAGL